MSIRPISTITLVVVLTACAATRVDDLAEYTPVPMDRVYPYPTQEERSQLGARITVAWDDVPGVPPAAVEPARELIQLRLEEFLSAIGVSVRVVGETKRATPVDLESAPGEHTGTEPADPDAASDEPAASVRDFGLTVRVPRLDYAATWKDPTNWLFKSEEEMAKRPGTCTHRADVEVTFGVLDDDSETPVEVLTLVHSGKEGTETLDQACPFAEEKKQALFSQVLDEALVCLRVPIENAFAPRGFVLEERRRGADDTHLFKTSLGLEQRVYESLQVDVLRAQHSTGADGRRRTAERTIATGSTTDQIGPGYAWILVDVRASTQPILEGDLVEAVYRESKTADLDPFGGCSDILSRQ